MTKILTSNNGDKIKSTVDDKFSSASDENPKPAGRPRAGVTAEALPHVRSQVADWIKQHRLDRWLQEDSGDFRFKAVEAFEQLPSMLDGNTEEAEAVAAVDAWCQQFLSKQGWQRLQANIRQWRYNRGSPSKILAGDGEPVRRPRRKTVQLTVHVRDRLSAFANRHSLTINEAVAELLNKAGED